MDQTLNDALTKEPCIYCLCYNQRHSNERNIIQVNILLLYSMGTKVNCLYH